ncbi:sulfur carrier protein ThiS [Paenibacillus sp. P96]|uniref:Sulfur carrier protein ThiS n=1 Tax=Paenibacillus zeirhizosphaerae TaxID=2987519 RepID=A0ABT9FV70_9BACL|nr:sulfur carrier protein ThiS [Paenibacillus sp. P96]MDP4098632.1 sulfur carrier protein ThiS [Paenibacillus sp. P96]
MKLVINGQEMIFDTELQNVDQLLKALDLQVKTVVVELNRHILTRDIHGVTGLKNGDRLEIVHFVGGG